MDNDLNEQPVWILTALKDWKDEFYVYFYDALSDGEYQKYMFCKANIGYMVKPLYFGTNEGWHNFNYFDDNFKFAEITENEYKVFEKCGIRMHSIIDHFLIALDNFFTENVEDFDITEDYWDDEYSVERFKDLVMKGVNHKNKKL